MCRPGAGDVAGRRLLGLGGVINDTALRVCHREGERAQGLGEQRIGLEAVAAAGAGHHLVVGGRQVDAADRLGGAGHLVVHVEMLVGDLGEVRADDGGEGREGGWEG